MSYEQSNAIVYLVDDEFAIRDALTLLIETAGFNIQSFESAHEFLDRYDHSRPGCLLLDVRMPSMSGLELQEELSKRDINIPIIFISGHAEVADSAKAFRAGAIDFLEKPFENSVLLERLEEGISKDIYARTERAVRSDIQHRLAQLTPREMEVLQLIISSHSNKESAKILKVSNRTVDAHRARIMEKLQAESLADLMKIAMHCDLL
ncbi:response regulator transcription factor [Methylomicrobium lacus]|uniref:response regulator transcription factor n=1 Tax=Methylomicrobium lacus TaxID=136992 RepID=UPI00045E676E|nr:response regulator [Methylomicrobium lacus]